MSPKMRWTAIKTALWIVCLAPLGWLLFAWFVKHDLGVNPIETITHETGWWALFFLTFGLGLTPLKRFSKWGWVQRFSRPIGLFAFFYACLHLLTYIWMDQSWEWAAMLKDVVKRPFITLGFAAWLLLLLLAATSTTGWQRRLKKNWKRVHRLVYLAAMLGVIHFALRFKTLLLDWRPTAFAATVMILLLLRINWRPKPQPFST